MVLCWEHCRSLAEANTNSHQKKITFPQNHSFIQIFLLNTNPTAGTVLETGDLTVCKTKTFVVMVLPLWRTTKNMNKQKYRTSDGGMGCEKNTAEKHDGPGVGRWEGRELTGSNQ